MPATVDHLLKAIQRGAGVDEAAAIRIAKSKGLVKQDGKHLALGPKMKTKGKK
jgi:hypothetical protein